MKLPPNIIPVNYTGDVLLSVDRILQRHKKGIICEFSHSIKRLFGHISQPVDMPYSTRSFMKHHTMAMKKIKL